MKPKPNSLLRRARAVVKRWSCYANLYSTEDGRLFATIKSEEGWPAQELSDARKVKYLRDLEILEEALRSLSYVKRVDWTLLGLRVELNSSQLGSALEAADKLERDLFGMHGVRLL